MSIETLQSLLDAGRTAWIPRDGESWTEFVQRKAPPRPGLFSPIERSNYAKALATALERGEKRAVRRAIFLPMWIANNEDEEPRDDEWRRRLFVWSDGEQLAEVDCPDDFASWARADVVHGRGAFVSLARHYAPGVGVDRFGSFAVVSGHVRTVIEKLDAIESAPPVAKPMRMVPAFSTMLEPAIDLKSAPSDITGAAEEIVRAGTNVVGDDE